jgi:class 3 adenylate cyclase
MVMLFADVKNFSKLDDGSYPDFFSTFLHEVKLVIESTEPRPVFVNTWGDGLYVVFDRIVDGAEFALKLVSRVERVDWAALGMPADITVRIGVHAGPVYQMMDPIIGRENVFGSHVNRAARIEPVTTPGCVYASEQFAAALAVEANHPFRCEYVGIEELAKGYDRCGLYVINKN